MEPTEYENTPLCTSDPVVTTGWYDRYIPTAGPTTLSTAVVGRKVTKVQLQLRQKRRKRREKFKKRQEKLKERNEREEEKERLKEEKRNMKIEKKRKRKRYKITCACASKKKTETKSSNKLKSGEVVCERQSLRLKMNLGFPRANRKTLPAFPTKTTTTLSNQSRDQTIPGPSGTFNNMKFKGTIFA